MHKTKCRFLAILVKDNRPRSASARSTNEVWTVLAEVIMSKLIRLLALSRAVARQMAFRTLSTCSLSTNDARRSFRRVSGC